MFSSAMPAFVPANASFRISSNPRWGGSMGKSIISMPSDSAIAAASSRLSCDVYRDGMRTPITFCAPSASAAITAVSAESTPPESPTSTFWKRCLWM